MTITRMLIANRGEIARRIMRTCRAMGIETVAVYSDADADAWFVLDADFAVPLGGSAPSTSYLRGDLIVDAARRSGADAVHPGYGFLSESATFAQSCLDAGMCWVGPPPTAIAAMGSKLAARELMTAAGVRVVPGEDLTGIADDRLAAVASRVGLPLLVKASAGGGGRGMRVVRELDSFSEAVVSARREAAAAFGDDTVFVERYIGDPRHIEIQVMADRHGNVVHLFERECSIQRRHQKIIEEAPSPFVSPELRAQMGEAAVRAAGAVGYEGAGTVEFIVGPDGTFFFLEMNTRLQVEHAVTEAITGLDLVRLQIEVADGHALAHDALAPTITGHAIEARIYAEDPNADYLPSPGDIRRFEVPEDAGVRVDCGVRAGDRVSPHYDPMLAKVIADAPTRDDAIRVLGRALRRTRADGVVTNRELLVAVLEHPEFGAGATDTGFLERHPPRTLTAGALADDDVEVAAVAAALAEQAIVRRTAGVLPAVTSGFRNNRSQPQLRTYRTGDRTIAVGYAHGRSHGRSGEPGEHTRTPGVEPAHAPRVEVSVDGLRRPDIVVVEAAPTSVVLVVDGIRHAFAVDVATGVVDVATARGSVTLDAVGRFPAPPDDRRPGSLVAPMPGTVVRVDAVVGTWVEVGTRLAVLEAMKMEHTITASAAGTVAEVRVAVGQVVDAGDVLVVVAEPEDA